MSNRKPTQQVVIPKGFIQPGEAAVIEIPRRYQRSPVVVVKRRVGEFAEARAASYFVEAPDETLEAQEQNFAPRIPKVAFSEKHPHTRQEIINHLERIEMRSDVPPRMVHAYGPPQIIPQPVYRGPHPGVNVALQPQILPQTAYGSIQPGMNVPCHSQVMPQSSFVATQSGMNVFPQQQVLPQPAFATTPTVPLQQHLVCGVNQLGVVPPQQQMTQRPSSCIPPHHSACPVRHELHFQQPPTFCAPPIQPVQCQGAPELAFTEIMETDAFNKSLKDYQRARRRFLANTKVMTAKSSRSNTSCDSCY